MIIDTFPSCVLNDWDSIEIVLDIVFLIPCIKIPRGHGWGSISRFIIIMNVFTTEYREYCTGSILVWRN